MIFIESRRTGYSPEQCRTTMTVGELIEHLQEFDENDQVYINNDDGYTYGEVTQFSVYEE